MIAIRAAQMASLEDHALSNFVDELRPALAKRYPHCLPCFPLPVQEQIVRNMVGRAGIWGITWQSALVAFAEMMLAVAPNFDEQPEVRTALTLDWLDPNRAMLSIDRRVSKKGWKTAESFTQNLPLFVSADWIGSPLLDQTAAALPIVVGDMIGGANPRELAALALSIATRLRISSVPDAGFTVAAWRLFYGAAFRDRREFPWLADIFNRSRSPNEIVAMLKLRISLDHQRYL